MNKSIIFFLAGAAIGSAITWLSVKEYYKAKEEEDVASVKAELRKSKAAAKEEKHEEEVKEYEKVVERHNYRSYSGKEEKETTAVSDAPYVIPPEEFGHPEYEVISLTYYSDGVLTEDDFKIEDPHELVGDFETHFGEYEDDSVFVRNDERRIDYEILKDLRTYEDVLEEKPYLRYDT